MRILWAYANSFIGASDAKLYQDLTVLDVFQDMTTLSDFWSVMKRGTSIASAGTIFQEYGVSPTAVNFNAGNAQAVPPVLPSFDFTVSNVHSFINRQVGTECEYTNALTFSNITISVFNGKHEALPWSVSATITLSNGQYQITPAVGGTGVFAMHGTWQSSNGYTEFTYTLSATDELAIRSTGSEDTQRYFVVSGSSTTTDANPVTTGPYWSAPKSFNAPALAGLGNPNWPSETPELAGAIEGTPETGVIDTFTDPWPGTPDDYSASIAWENGSVTTVTGTSSAYGQIVYKDTSDPSQGFEIIGSQTYAEVGLYAVRTVISDSSPFTFTVTVNDADGATDTGQHSVTVVPQGMLGWGQAIPMPSSSGSSGPDFSGLVGTFVDLGVPDGASHYSAVVTVPGVSGAPIQTVQPVYDSTNQEFYVYASSYPLPSPTGDAVSVTMFEDDVQVGWCASGIGVDWRNCTGAITMSEGAHIEATDGSPSQFEYELASFTVNDPNATANSFTANVDWGGDGSDSSVSIVPDPAGNGTFDVEGTYTLLRWWPSRRTGRRLRGRRHGCHGEHRNRRQRRRLEDRSRQHRPGRTDRRQCR